MAADTRFTYRKPSAKADDAQKLWPLSETAFAGYSGVVELAEFALVAVSLAIEKHQWKQPNQVIQSLQTWLRYRFQQLPPKRQGRATQLLLGLRDPDAASYPRYRLYRLRSFDDFELHEENRLVVCGTGKSLFDRAFPPELDFWIKRWWEDSRAGSFVRGTRGEPVYKPPLRRADVGIANVHALIAGAMDSALRANSALKSSSIRTVGGLVQSLALTDQGFQRCGGIGPSNEFFTAGPLRSNVEIQGRSYPIPYMDATFGIDGSKTF